MITTEYRVMYSLEQISVSTVIDDKSIKLPRFQRKESWTDEKRFQLCVSVFKGYPIGTVVFRKEDVYGKSVKWLLDGRQRIDTLKAMRNPYNIYAWAKSFIKFKDRDSADEMTRSFYAAINKFLFREPNTDDEGDYDDECDDYVEMMVESPFNESNDNYIDGVDELLSTIMAVHDKSRNTDAFTKPFDIKADGFKAKYMSVRDDGRLYVDSNKLTEWIYGNFEDEGEITVESVYDSFNNTPSIKGKIEENISQIKKSIETVLKIKERLQESRISIVTLNESCTENDSRKIFEIINTQGTKLSNVEVLSAKPAWAKRIVEPREVLKENVNKLYSSLNIPIPDDVVYWDVAATFTCRLPEESDFIMGDIRKMDYDTTTSSGKTETDKKITYGFKLYAGRYSNSVSKGAIETLPSNKDAVWEYSSFEDEIRKVCKLLHSADPSINCLNGYKYPLHKMMGDAVTMCYLFLLLKKYQQCAKEDGSEQITKSSTKRKFIVNSHVLLDRLFYEYCTGVWKGSGDSRLRSCMNEPDIVFEKVDDETWNKLIDDLYLNNTIGEYQPKTAVLNALVYYFSMVRGKVMSLQLNESVEIDHIIPKSKFFEGSSGFGFRDSLINYALLPSSLNNMKKDNVRNLEAYHKKRICDLEDLSEDSLLDITEAGAIDLLKEKRKHIIEDLKSSRESYVRGEGMWGLQLS